jgi:uncharacterized membrane protein HdeD (DUF308 family)
VSAFSASATSGDLLAALRRGRRRLMVAGILALVLGVVAIVVPAVASVATAIFIGWILLIASAYQLADALSVRHRGRMGLRIVLTLLSFAGGLYLLVAPLEGTITLTVVLVIWFIATGTARLTVGLAESGMPGAGMMALNGVISIVLGVLIGAELPSSADWAIGLLVGIDLLFAGVLLLALARQLGRVAP